MSANQPKSEGKGKYEENPAMANPGNSDQLELIQKLAEQIAVAFRDAARQTDPFPFSQDTISAVSRYSEIAAALTVFTGEIPSESPPAKGAAEQAPQAQAAA